LLGTLPYPAFLLSPAGQIRDTNDAMAALIEIPREQLRYRSLFDVVDPTNHATCEQLLMAACVQSGTAQVGEIALVTSGGATLLVRYNVLLLAQAMPPQLLAIGQPLQEWLALLQEVIDLSAELEIRNIQLVQLNGQLQQAEQQRERVTNMLVHDIRSPLVATSAGLEIAQRGLANMRAPSIVTEALGAGLRSLRAVIDLTNELLDMKKLSKGHELNEIEPVALAPLCAEVQATLQALAVQQRATIDMSALPRDIVVRGERRLLRRVILNVLTNAIRFTLPGGVVTIAARLHERNQVFLVVADQGPGVVPGDRERIFLPFMQGAGESHRGSGLGLAFCREVLQAHGGQIWVEDRPGGGSCFCMTLPQQHCEA
jgi:signal transduction histidine kinase